MTITAAGAGYLNACEPALAQLRDAEEDARGLTARSKGTLVIGVQHVIARGCLTAALPHFHARYPEIGLDVRNFQRVTDEQVAGVDVMLVLGWPKVDELVHRSFGAGKFIVAASPSYWAAHGMPQRPKDLEQHTCLSLRDVNGTVMDLWTFARGTEQESISR